MIFVFNDNMSCHCDYQIAVQYIVLKSKCLDLKFLFELKLSIKMLILFAPIDGSGATNSSIGIAEVLQKHGHKIVFLVQKTWQGKLKALGFEEVIYEDNKPKGNLQNEKHWLITFIENISPFLPKSPIQHEKGYGIMKKQMLFDLAKRSNDVLQDLVLKINPDIILIDNLVSIPALINSKIPWIRLCSAQVLFVLDNLNDGQAPPSCSGISFLK